ncbi:MAG: cobyric acid synthase, partial [Chloroflexi bacterium]|nr:cobyric acid synthase [Chloroflexota bacterium]
FVTPDGAEIGRSQAVQAEAAGVLPSVDMNPVLLKPEVDYRSQLVVMGKPVGHLESKNFNRRKEGLWETVTGALDRLRSEYEVVVIEGAGSPAEINLRQGDIVNMEVALYSETPVLLVGDIDKGGIFASLYGTVCLIAPEERALIKGVVINKFRGDVDILKPGLTQLEEMIDVPVLGVVPYFRDIYIPEEDSPSAENISHATDVAVLDVAVIALPHIANFDDFDPLKRDAGVNLRYVRSFEDLGSPDLVILPGTKTTVSDLNYLYQSGLAKRIMQLAGDGTAVIGICGGYQMLGEAILDPLGVESEIPEVRGMGLLPVITTFVPEKETHQVTGSSASGVGLLEGSEGLSFEGYEIHMGTSEPTTGATGGSPPLRIASRSGVPVDGFDGALSEDGWVLGTYVHGLFLSTELRRSILSRIASRKGVGTDFAADDFSQSEEFDKLADLIRSSLDMDAIYEIAGLERPGVKG